VPLFASLVADRDFDSRNARLIFVYGAAGHNDLGGLQGQQGEARNPPEPESLHHWSSAIMLDATPIYQG
jgi:hypothetical protein